MVRDEISALIQTALKACGYPQIDVQLEHPVSSTFGDYSTNVAMKLTKDIKLNPFETAEKIKQAIPVSSLISHVEVVKPGFINLYLSPQTLLSELQLVIHQKEGYGISDILKGKRVAVEYTDPNPFKEMHIGHLYSNIVGESLARLYEAVGATVWRVCYQGDVGLHVAKSLWGLLQIFKEGTHTREKMRKMTSSEQVHILGGAYARGAQAYEDDENAKKEIQELNKRIYEKDPEYEDLFQEGRSWSLSYFEEVYKRLGVNNGGGSFNAYFFERDIGEKGKQMVLKHPEVFEMSEDAWIFAGEKYGLHNRVFINSLGLPTYEAKELALAPAKYEKFVYDTSVIVTGNEINEYFRVLLKALEMIHPELAQKTVHIGHGMVRLPEGKMSSRTGKVITAEWLLDTAKKQAVQKVEEVLAARGDGANSVGQDEQTAETVAQAAIKYAFLRSGIGKNIEFSFNESISFEGSSGPYLLYTYARARSVLAKVDSSFDSSASLSEFTTEEEMLLRTLYIFPEVVVAAAQQNSPNFIATYLYDLAQKYNLFYQNTPIIKSEAVVKTLRLQLTQAVSTVMKNGLWMLGVQTVEKI